MTWVASLNVRIASDLIAAYNMINEFTMTDDRVLERPKQPEDNVLLILMFALLFATTKQMSTVTAGPRRARKSSVT